MAPANGATLAGTATLTASASDNKGVAKVQFQVDGNDLGGPITSTPYSNLGHDHGLDGPLLITAIATDTSGNTASRQHQRDGRTRTPTRRRRRWQSRRRQQQ